MILSQRMWSREWQSDVYHCFIVLNSSDTMVFQMDDWNLAEIPEFNLMIGYAPRTFTQQ